MSLAEAKVGRRRAGQGAQIEVSTDRTGALRMSDGLLEESLEGDEIFSAFVPVAGVDHAASLTTTEPYALVNPIGSGVDLVVVAVGIGYVSGTLGAGFLAAAQYLQSTSANAVPTGTACAITSNRLGSGGASRAKPLYTVTLTAAPTLLFPVLDIAPKLATTAINQDPGIAILPIKIVVPEGATLVLGGVCGAAGSSPKVTIGAFWREIRRV